MTENKLIRDENEAIDCLKNNKPTSGFYMLQESVDMAIQALEEIQQYRSIGTVEEISKLIKFLSCDDDTSILEYLRMLIEYRAIGTVEEFKALKEKNEPKEMDRFYCPICRHYFEDTDAYNYCPACGQKMKPIWQ